MTLKEMLSAQLCNFRQKKILASGVLTLHRFLLWLLNSKHA